MKSQKHHLILELCCWPLTVAGACRESKAAVWRRAAMSARKAAEGQRPIVSLSRWHFFLPGISLHRDLKVVFLLARERGWPWSHHCAGVLAQRDWSYDASTEEEGDDTSTGFIPSSKHCQERPDKSLLRRFLLKRWCIISPHQIPHGVIISIHLPLVVHAVLACTPPRIWVSLAMTRASRWRQKRALFVHRILPDILTDTQRSSALLRHAALFYVLSIHATATQPFSNTTAPCWLAALRLVFRERRANFQHGDL